MAIFIISKRASLLAQKVKNPPTMQEIWVRSLGWEDTLEEGMATHSSIFAMTFIIWSFLSHPLQNRPSYTHTHCPLNSNSFPPGSTEQFSTDHALGAFLPNKVIYFSKKMTFPFMVFQHPVLKSKHFSLP